MYIVNMRKNERASALFCSGFACARARGARCARENNKNRCVLTRRTRGGFFFRRGSGVSVKRSFWPFFFKWISVERYCYFRLGAVEKRSETVFAGLLLEKYVLNCCWGSFFSMIVVFFYRALNRCASSMKNVTKHRFINLHWSACLLYLGIASSWLGKYFR